MNLTEKAILEFQKLYFRLYNINISPEEAMQYGQTLIALIYTILN